jgi:hypothetical protein
VLSITDELRNLALKIQIVADASSLVNFVKKSIFYLGINRGALMYNLLILSNWALWFNVTKYVKS